ncbi:putative transcription factor C2H2 family [Helianthus debilis subsp. tardiflorus]
MTFHSFINFLSFLKLFISAKMRLLSSSSTPPSSNTNPHINSKNNSTFLFVRIRTIVIVIAVMLVICGLLHLLVKYLIKKKRLLLLLSSSNSHFQESGVNQEEGDAYERQLQQLFNLHDSGLDQGFIDALPVFSYGELMGLKEPFDCAVCLCEFTQKDSLRLLPLCSHAFHMHCIDTWLLSNSTCPLCRGVLFAPEFSVENPGFEVNDSREEEEVVDDSGQGYFGHFKQSEGSSGNEKRVHPVRLVGKREEREVGETSNSKFDDGVDGQGHFGHFSPFDGSIGKEKKVYGQGHFGHFNQHEGSIGNEKRVYGQGHFGHFNQHEGGTGTEKRVYGQGHFGHFNQHEGSIGNEKRVYGQGHFDHFNQHEGGTGNEKRVYGQGHFGHFNEHEGSIGNEKRVYSVKLGKFRASNVGKREEKGETSNSNLDARRCYSMGTYEYVVGNSELRVECVPSNSRRGSFGNKVDSSIDGGNNGKKISNRSKGESFSVSKIWLWSKKDHNHQKSQIFSGSPYG